MAKKTPKKTEYEVTAKIMGKKYVSNGETILSALEGLKPKMIAGHTILTVKNGEKVKERIIPMGSSRRLFLSAGMTREVALKQTSTLFEGI